MSHIEEEFNQIEREHSWNAVFHKLANDHGVRTLDKKTDIALLNINRGLNRFRDVLPYDDTRVVLTGGANDYINANYVEVPWANRRYILTQGPLQTTSEHFWQMVWQQDSRVIVMLTRLIEKGYNKCWLYYPDYENDSELAFNQVDLKVTFLSEKQERHYTQRRFELTNLATGEARSIIHWADFDWPDHGAPRSPEPFLQLLGDVRHSGAFDPRFGPPIIHCSAGIGRSGTFVLVDSILKIFAHTQNPGDVSLIEVLAHIRTQRHGLIQTAEQLRFSYLAIVAGLKELDELEQRESSFPDNEFDMSSESENDGDDEDDNHPKMCRRQDNIMPTGRLTDSLEDINCELMRRADSTVSSYHPSPVIERRLHSASGSRLGVDDGNFNNHYQPSTTTTSTDIETSLRLRQERLTRNEAIEKKLNEMKAKLHQQTPPNSPSSSSENPSLFSFLSTKYRRPIFIGFLTVITGSLLIYKFVYNNGNRNR